MHERSLILQFNIINESFGSCTNNLNCTLLGQLLEGLIASNKLNRCGGHTLFPPAWEKEESMHSIISFISFLQLFQGSGLYFL